VIEAAMETTKAQTVGVVAHLGPQKQPAVVVHPPDVAMIEVSLIGFRGLDSLILHGILRFGPIAVQDHLGTVAF
jgi:hypothetical protein